MAQKMTGAILPGNSTVELREFPVPQPGHGQVLVKMQASTICGSDIRAIYREHLGKGPEGYTPGMICGHEPAGKIVATGPGMRRFQEGDRVILYHISGCGRCHDCRTGYQISCSSPLRAAYGWQRDGGNAEFCLAEEADCILMPDSMSYIDGACVACGFGTCYEAIRRIGVSGDDIALVVGLGPMGLASLMLARARGATKVIGVDVVDDRLALTEKLGLADLVDQIGRERPRSHSRGDRRPRLRGGHRLLGQHARPAAGRPSGAPVGPDRVRRRGRHCRTQPEPGPDPRPEDRVWILGDQPWQRRGSRRADAALGHAPGPDLHSPVSLWSKRRRPTEPWTKASAERWLSSSIEPWRRLAGSGRRLRRGPPQPINCSVDRAMDRVHGTDFLRLRSHPESLPRGWELPSGRAFRVLTSGPRMTKLRLSGNDTGNDFAPAPQGRARLGSGAGQVAPLSPSRATVTGRPSAGIVMPYSERQHRTLNRSVTRAHRFPSHRGARCRLLFDRSHAVPDRKPHDARGQSNAGADRGTPTPTPAPTKSNVTLEVMASQDWIKSSEQVLAGRFEEQTGIHLDFQIIPSAQYFNVLTTKLQSGQGIDLFLGQAGVVGHEADLQRPDQRR